MIPHHVAQRKVFFGFLGAGKSCKGTATVQNCSKNLKEALKGKESRETAADSFQGATKWFAWYSTAFLAFQDVFEPLKVA